MGASFLEKSAFPEAPVTPFVPVPGRSVLLVFLFHVSHVLLKHWCSIEQFKGWATTTYEVIFFNADHPNGTLAKSFDCSGHDINTFPETRVHDDGTTSVPGGSFVTKLRLKVTGAPPKDECE